jgi:hypothetical protein
MRIRGVKCIDARSDCCNTTLWPAFTAGPVRVVIITTLRPARSPMMPPLLITRDELQEVARQLGVEFAPGHPLHLGGRLLLR